MRLLDNLRPERASAFDRRVEVVHLEPEQNAVPVRGRIGFDQIVVLLLVPGVELKDQPSLAEQAIIDLGVLVAAETVDVEELAVPATAGPDVSYGDQRLRAHRHSPSRSPTHRALRGG
jgi:hypothetical protein